MNDTEKLALIREAMPATETNVYLNTGSVGPMAQVTSDALHAAHMQAMTQGRASIPSFMAAFEALSGLRQAFAELVNVKASEIALTHHTTEGMNIVSHGLTWQPGDEVITTNFEHPGGLFPLYTLRQRQGVVVKVVHFTPEDGPQAFIDRLTAAMSPRTRLLAISHVAWNTGLLLPLAEIVQAARERYVLTLVDGAQSAGAIPLDLTALGVDFYAMPAQKWLCGPEGLGALYVRQNRLSELLPTFTGYLSMGLGGVYDTTGNFMPAPDARRYEVGSIYRPGIAAMVANLRWLSETIGWSWIHQRILHLAHYARESLCEMPGITMITPPGSQAGLVTFNLDGYDPARVMMKLLADNIIVRFLGDPYALRISTGFYNSEADIDRLINGLKAIQQLDPDSLPMFEIH